MFFSKKPLFAEMRLALRGVQDGVRYVQTEGASGACDLRPLPTPTHTPPPMGPDGTGPSADARNRLPSISFASRPRWVYLLHVRADKARQGLSGGQEEEGEGVGGIGDTYPRPARSTLLGYMKAGSADS